MNNFDKAKKIIKRLKRKGYQALLAGGCVRDMLLNKEPNDFDIATSATPDQVEKIFKHTKAVGKAFGVVLVKIKNTDFEVATFRKDGSYEDGRRPASVFFLSSAEEDANRRDFTINALFYDPVKKQILDFVDGKKDLERKRIRFVGDAQQRIREDNLRLIRAIRFAIKLDFWIDPTTMEIIRNNAQKLANVSFERIREELMKMLALGKPRKMLDLLFESNLIDFVIPEFRALQGCEQSPKHHPEGTVLEHTTRVMEHLVNERPMLQLAGILHDIGKPATSAVNETGDIITHGHDEVGAKIAREIMTRLKFSNDEIEYVADMVAEHMKYHFVRSMKKSSLKRYMALPYFDDLTKLSRADISSASKDFSSLEYIEQKKKEWKPEEIKPKNTLINGDDLINLGFKPGPIFKTILSVIEDGQLEGKLKTKEEALEVAKTFLGG